MATGETQTAVVSHKLNDDIGLRFDAVARRMGPQTWTPQLGDVQPEDRDKGEKVLPVTVILSYRQNGQNVRVSQTADIRIKLDTTRLRRRLDSKLNFLMGKVPQGLKT